MKVVSLAATGLVAVLAAAPGLAEEESMVIEIKRMSLETATTIA